MQLKPRLESRFVPLSVQLNEKKCLITVISAGDQLLDSPELLWLRQS